MLRASGSLDGTRLILMAQILGASRFRYRKLVGGAAERLARLATELNEAAMVPVKTAAQELRPTEVRLERGQPGQLGASAE